MSLVMMLVQGTVVSSATDTPTKCLPFNATNSNNYSNSNLQTAMKGIYKSLAPELKARAVPAETRTYGADVNTAKSVGNDDDLLSVVVVAAAADINSNTGGCKYSDSAEDCWKTKPNLKLTFPQASGTNGDKVFAMTIGDVGAGGNLLSNSESCEIYPGWKDAANEKYCSNGKIPANRKITNSGTKITNSGTKWYDISAGF
jgi:hypothetical protein